jgi:hypothetical protein
MGGGGLVIRFLADFALAGVVSHSSFSYISVPGLDFFLVTSSENLMCLVLFFPISGTTSYTVLFTVLKIDLGVFTVSDFDRCRIAPAPFTG